MANQNKNGDLTDLTGKSSLENLNFSVKNIVKMKGVPESGLFDLNVNKGFTDLPVVAGVVVEELADE